MTDLQTPTPRQVAARELAAGLAEAGAFAAANPDLPGLRPKEHRLYVSLGYMGYSGGDTRARIQEWIAAAHAAGARVTEIEDKDSGGVQIWFGPVCWRVYAPTEELGGERPQTKRVRRRAHKPLLADGTTGAGAE